MHSKTDQLPAAFADGDVAIWPFMHIAPVYFFPSLEQGGLLYQPLHFHEFGHGLYVLHKPELDALVKELQQVVRDALMPLSNRNDAYASAQGEQREIVVNRRFDWAQEFFCDAVGLTIGGAAYLYAFSSYCSDLSQTAFYQSAAHLGKSKHPVTWLRIRMLIRRANELGLVEASARVETEWNTMARVLKIIEDHHGFYDDNMADDIHRIISDMLIETSPRQFVPEEISPERDANVNDTPVFLLNSAWRVRHTRGDEYPDWEKKCIAAYLTT